MDEVTTDAAVTADGHAGYDATNLGGRPHEAVAQTNADKREGDCVQICHWTTSQLKRWLVRTHALAMKSKHLQAHLDEFASRWNHRNTDGVARIAARLIENAVTTPPLPMWKLVETSKQYRRFQAPFAKMPTTSLMHVRSNRDFCS